MDLEENVCKESVFEALFQKHSKELYNFLRFKFSTLDVHDIVQDAFVKLWNNCKAVQPSKARAYLYTVANNQSLNELSKLKTARKYEGAGRESSREEAPDFILEKDEFAERLQQALDDLTDDLRITFLMNRVEGKKHQEIADILGISRKAVEKRIYKALALIREKVDGL